MVSEDKEWAEVFASFKAEENQKKALTSVSLRDRIPVATVKESGKAEVRCPNDDDLVEEMYRFLLETETENWKETRTLQRR